MWSKKQYYGVVGCPQRVFFGFTARAVAGVRQGGQMTPKYWSGS